jgi:two-component system CheB/CheR fusion protein
MDTKCKPTRIVGIGGSAGGLQAYQELLDALPPDTGMAFVFIAHLSPTHESLLALILSRSTYMPSIQAAEGMEIKPNHVYVIPPNADLSIEDCTFKVSSPRTLAPGNNKQIDYFLRSLADAMGPRAIAIILSGYDGDGTKGCKRIKEMGGLTFAQDLSAEIDSMPLHAEAAGCIDHVLAPSKISEALTKLGAHSYSGSHGSERVLPLQAVD